MSFLIVHAVHRPTLCPRRPWQPISASPSPLTIATPDVSIDCACGAQTDALDQEALAAINAYSPGLSSAWMLQRAMSVRPGSSPSPNFVNRLLGANFAAMQRDSEATLKTFLQVSCWTS